MLDAAETVLRELPSVVARSRVELRGSIRPPVEWRPTLIRRRQATDQSIFCLRTSRATL